ncbi:hypothetical protein OE88DRAFT_712810 [Heliocybe sulcata]|uniref:G-protein coupled receptors family 1 profile domain-containing protein n=1 Tax=Heliocybe sulcata TaxID=5364 RepID=A0A5C3NGS1_9AGAM|nr:hypothetical protein OE88DRAFT_712810 [Heliocybe sulcata]
MGPSSLLDSLDGVVVHGNHTLTIVWLVLNIWPSHLGLPVLVATIYLSRRVYRNPTFLSMCITWWIDGLASSLLFWSGHQTGSDPSYGLCLAQASLLYGVPAMTALSGFFLIHTLFYSLDRPPSTGPETSSREWNRTTYYKLVTPYAIWLASLVVAIIVGRAFPELVSRDQHYFFCAVNSKPLHVNRKSVLAVWHIADIHRSSLKAAIHGCAVVNNPSRNDRPTLTPDHGSVSAEQGCRVPRELSRFSPTLPSHRIRFPLQHRHSVCPELPSIILGLKHQR